jgi:antirestriction protein ArdC
MHVYETITNRIIESLEAGRVPWKQGWKNRAANGGGSLPYNLTNGKRYRGINTLSLMCSGYTSNGWATYKQAQALGYQVRKGEKSTPVVWWSFPTASEKLSGERTAPYAKFYSVFNVEQMDGVSDLLPLETPAFDPIAEAELIADNYMLSGSHPTLAHGGSSAYFSPAHDPCTDASSSGLYRPP